MSPETMRIQKQCESRNNANPETQHLTLLKTAKLLIARDHFAPLHHTPKFKLKKPFGQIYFLFVKEAQYVAFLLLHKR